MSDQRAGGGARKRASRRARERASTRAWELAHRQHGVLARAQLLKLGFSREAIAHRLRNGRLHPVARGVYAVGRPELTQEGRWMAAILSCGPGTVLSHRSAAALWEIATEDGGHIEVTTPSHRRRRRPGTRVHRRRLSGAEVTSRRRIPVTAAAVTLVDLAACWTRGRIEAAVNEADKRDVIDPETLRSALDGMPRRPGIGALRELLDRRTFALTDSELERRFLRLARSAGLPLPETGRQVNGFKVDFLWPELGLVVETDGLRYHRTPAQQARDRLRDQAHLAAGLTSLRFSHAQVRFEPQHVRVTLARVAARLQRRDASPAASST